MYYAVHVEGGKEDYIVSLILSKLPKDIFNEVFTPKHEVIRRKEGNDIIVTKPVFPGYIFVDSDKIKDFAVAMIHLPQYAKVLGRTENTGEFLSLTDEECLMIDTICGKDVSRLLKTSFVSITEGKKVTVITGPLAGFAGKVKKVDLHHRVAYVETSILGNVVDIAFAINFLKTEETY